MSTLGDIFGAGGVAGFLGKIADKIWPDPEAKARATLAILEAQQRGEFKAIDADLQLAQMQADVNKVEAGNASIFVSGWRPFIGWVCGCSLAYTFVVLPLLQSVAAFGGLNFDVAKLPALESGELMTVLLGMLGLGGLRTFEKHKGVEHKR